jgi:aminoglycoside phosphotransferase (APT) family kinase protein
VEPVPEVDYEATSTRPQWADLPPGVREALARAAGGPVHRAEPSVTSGFSGGFAAVLHLASGQRVFAKAGSDANPHLIDAYRREALVLAALPRAVPAPRLVGAAAIATGEADERAWQVVVAEAVEGRMPHPWTEPALDAVHEACLIAAEALDPPPAALEPVLGSLAADYAEDASIRRVFADLDAGRTVLTWGQPAWVPRRYAELDALLALAPSALAGTVGTHGDLRADNVLVGGGRAVVVDWNWLSLGPAWADVVGVLPPARADGLDVDRRVRTGPLTRDADPEHIDSWLAVIAAYMLANADSPPFPGGSPVIRVHQRRYARMFLDWLGDRRGWTS